MVAMVVLYIKMEFLHHRKMEQIQWAIIQYQLNCVDMVEVEVVQPAEAADLGETEELVYRGVGICMVAEVVVMELEQLAELGFLAQCNHLVRVEAAEDITHMAEIAFLEVEAVEDMVMVGIVIIVGFLEVEAVAEIVIHLVDLVYALFNIMYKK